MSTRETARVLYVEDDPGAARLLQKRLQRAGYAVDLARDAHEGLGMYESGDYDVLALDQDLPQLTGLEIIRILAARGPLPPTIMITGAGSETIAAEAIKLGADDYIIKDTGAKYLELVPSIIERAREKKRLVLEKQTAEEELLKFRTSADRANYGIIMADMVGNLIYMNEAFAAMHGYTRGEVLGKHHSVFHTEEQLPHVNAFNARLMREGSCDSEEVWHRRRDGTVFPTLVNATVIKSDGKPVFLSATVMDISEQKQGEEALRQSEERYRTLVETMNDGLVVLDADGVITYVNEKFAEMLGFARQDLIGLSHQDVVNEKGSPGRDPAFLERPTGRFAAYETELVARGGRRVPVILSGSPLFDAGGKTIGTFAVFTDITERKQAEQSLRQAKQDWERTFDAVPDLMAIIDCSHRILRVNRSMAERLGIRPDEAIGSACHDLVHGKDSPIASCPHVQLMQDGEEHQREFYVDRLGGTFHVSVSPITTLDGRLEGCIHIARDISEYKRMERDLVRTIDELQQSNREILALLEALKAMQANMGFQESAKRIFDACKKVTGATAGYVALLSDDGSENEVLFVDAGGLSCTVDESLPMPTRGLRAETYRTGRALYENDFCNSDWMKFIPEGHARLDNVMFAPIVIEDKVVGVLGLANKPKGFNDNDARLAEAFGEFAAAAIFNSRMIDSLTQSEEK